MAPIGQIYGYAGHPKVSRVIAAAAYNGVEVEIVETQVMKGDTKKPEYLALFPYGKIPGFKGSDGFTLIEGKAIARYGTCSQSHFNLLFRALSLSLVNHPASCYNRRHLARRGWLAARDALSAPTIQVSK